MRQHLSSIYNGGGLGEKKCTDTDDQVRIIAGPISQLVDMEVTGKYVKHSNTEDTRYDFHKCRRVLDSSTSSFCCHGREKWL